MVGITGKSIWKSNLLLAAFSLSVANLNLMNMWRILIFASDQELYFVPTLKRHDYIGALLLMLILAGGVFLVLKPLVSRDSDEYKWTVLAACMVCVVNPLLFLISSIPAFLVVAVVPIELKEGYLIPHLGASLLYLVIPMASAAVLFWKWRQFSVHALYLLLVILCPFALSNVAQAMWQAAFLDNENCTSGESPRPVERAEMNAEPVDLQRLMWIIFDELDQRILFDKRPAGYEFTGFDSFRRQSIYMSRVVPPGSLTETAMPTYWIGQRVVKSRKRSCNRLEVQIEGSEGFLSVSDFDHIFKGAFAAGASTGIAGFYHPYCRLFGEFADRCQAFFLESIQDRASNSLASSMKWSARILLPEWRKARTVRTFESIRFAALEMAIDPEKDFVVVHVNMPHVPYVYDPSSDELTIWGSGLSYADNVSCADKMLSEIERESRKAGLWDKTAVVVMADHGWRSMPGFGSEPGAIPLMIKMPGQSEEIRLDEELDSVLTKRLCLSILQRELRTSQDVVSWLRSQ